MLLYALRRLLLAIPTLIGIALVTFLVSNALPRDIVLINLGDRATQDPEIVAAFKQKWGLDQPLPVQYLRYLGHLARGDLGTSIATNRPVLRELVLSVPATLELAAVAIVLSVPPGIFFGVVSAARRGRGSDLLIRGFSSIGLAIPTFWLALLMLLTFYLQLGWAPGPGRLDAGISPPPAVTGMYTVDALLARDAEAFRNAAAHIVLPALVLAIVSFAFIVRITRESMLEVLNQDYVRTARAKGLAQKVVIGRHALRNALIPVITVTGTLYAQLMAGTVLTETIFSWPGIGRYAFSSASSLDFPAIMGTALVIGTTYILINLVVDLLYAVVNPRIRYD
ncbi:MAG: ABC transporter permease [Armatimonadota bacterium]